MTGRCLLWGCPSRELVVSGPESRLVDLGCHNCRQTINHPFSSIELFNRKPLWHSNEFEEGELSSVSRHSSSQSSSKYTDCLPRGHKLAFWSLAPFFVPRIYISGCVFCFFFSTPAASINWDFMKCHGAMEWDEQNFFSAFFVLREGWFQWSFKESSKSTANLWIWAALFS